MSVHQEEARRVLDIEREAIEEVARHLDEQFDQAVERLYACPGTVIVVGVGKSGLIGRKVAATLSSTGTPAFFLHATEGGHGDLGVVRSQDICLILSKSGETAELLDLLPAIRRVGAGIVSLVGRSTSTLARESDVVLDVSVKQEACPHDLAPTASTVAMLAMGDALAIALLKRRGFGPEQFALLHPGGTLGKRLLLRVRDLMHGGEENPVVPLGASMTEVIDVLVDRRLGAVSIVDQEGRLQGLFADGDLKRAIIDHGDVRPLSVEKLMTRRPTTITPDRLAHEALALMENRPFQIAVLPVVDAEGRAVGLLRLHDILRAGIV